MKIKCRCGKKLSLEDIRVNETAVATYRLLWDGKNLNIELDEVDGNNDWLVYCSWCGSKLNITLDELEEKLRKGVIKK